MAKKERRRGHPPKYTLPEPIEGLTPKELAQSKAPRYVSTPDSLRAS